MRKSRFLATVAVFLLAVFFFAFHPAFAGRDEPEAGETIGTLKEIIEYICEDHIKNPPMDALVRGAIDGVLEALDDPYTEYLPPEELKNFTGSLDGDYVGVGIQLKAGGDYPEVVGIIEGSPASGSGIEPGDLIIRVDGEDMAGFPLSEVVQKIRGPEGTKVRLTVRRAGRGNFEVELTRKSINIPTVVSKKLENGTGYIKIGSFGSHTAGEFKKALKELLGEGTDKLILDLRDCPGGLLQQVVKVAGCFLDKGSTVVRTEGKAEGQREFCTDTAPQAKGIPLAVLVNQSSASAAEILAGALQDYKAAVIVGEKTFGKGTVQTVIPLKNGGALKLTTARYCTPKGRALDGTGLLPDVQVLTPELQLALACRVLTQPSNYTLVLDTVKGEAELNGMKLQLSKPVLPRGETVYLPLRFVFEAMGYRVDWQEADGSIKVEGGNQRLYIGKDGRITADGLENNTAGSVFLENDTSYLPLFTLDKLGFRTSWNGNTITIEK